MLPFFEAPKKRHPNSPVFFIIISFVITLFRFAAFLSSFLVPKYLRTAYHRYNNHYSLLLKRYFAFHA